MANLTIHTIVKNEEKWIWYALMAVKGFADQILVFDTGSNDKTPEIIRTIKDKKIIFEEKGSVSAGDLVKLRQEQLERTKTDWFLLVDGDEIWPKRTMVELKEAIKKASTGKWGVVVRAWNLVDDVYHYHPESDYYHWPFAPKNYSGWANLRALRHDIPGLKITGKYPLEAYCDKTGTPIQNYGRERLAFLKNRYLHTTYLPRSNFFNDSKTLNRKFKFEIGKKFPKTFSFPEVFYLKRPSIVNSPWKRRSFFTFGISTLLTLLKGAKRKVLQ